MRIFKFVAVFATIFVLMLISSIRAQSLVSSSDSLLTLEAEISSAEQAVEEMENLPSPSTAAERKENLRILYTAKAQLARAEHQYFLYCRGHLPEGDLANRSLFGQRAFAAKRRANKYEGIAYSYAPGNHPRVITRGKLRLQ